MNHKLLPDADPRRTAHIPPLLRDAAVHQQRGRVRDQGGLENVFGAGRSAGEDDRAGFERLFDGEGGVAVPAAEEHGVGGDEEAVDGGVAVGGADDGEGGAGGEAAGVNCVGGV